MIVPPARAPLAAAVLIPAMLLSSVLIPGSVRAQSPAPVEIKGLYDDQELGVTSSLWIDNALSPLTGDEWTHLGIRVHYPGEIGFLFVHTSLNPTQPGGATIQQMLNANPQLRAESWTGLHLDQADPANLYTVHHASLGAPLAIPPARIALFLEMISTSTTPQVSAWALAPGRLGGASVPTNLGGDFDERQAWGLASWTTLGGEPVVDLRDLLEQSVIQASRSHYSGLTAPGLAAVANHAAYETFLDATFQVITVSTTQATPEITLKQPVHITRRSAKQIDDPTKVAFPARYFPTVAGFWLHIAQHGQQMEVPFWDQVTGLRCVWLVPGQPPVVANQEYGPKEVANFIVPDTLPTSVTLTYFLDAAGNAVWPKYPFAGGAAPTIVVP
ncbi:MAG: hypothetical protein AAF628_34960 [Planctomycetota bacterium]